MAVKIKIPPGLYYLTDDCDEIDVNAGTVRECLGQLVLIFPQVKEILFNTEGKLHRNLDIYVNGKSCFNEGLDRLTREGDKIYILSVIEGG